MRVFILNGPPGIGKDTLAANIEKVFGFPVLMFKAALYRETAKYFGIPVVDMIRIANDRFTKEEPDPGLDGFSPRGALIHVSESIIKPTHGKKFFGLRAVAELTELDGRTSSAVFSDGGFVEETECLVEHGFDVHIIHLHHPDFNFDRDSRNYVYGVPGAKPWRLNVTMGEPMTDLHNFMKILENIDR
ncbi:hypothetical protein [Pseudomonas laurylsulfatiphila]|uniref:hypothetical protein n=1 Tax=Pseudomonas laurylsulfatiphila TaxID=2011015 RepID=UPI003D198D21